MDITVPIDRTYLEIQNLTHKLNRRFAQGGPDLPLAKLLILSADHCAITHPHKDPPSVRDMSGPWMGH